MDEQQRWLFQFYRDAEIQDIAIPVNMRILLMEHLGITLEQYSEIEQALYRDRIARLAAPEWEAFQQIRTEHVDLINRFFEAQALRLPPSEEATRFHIQHQITDDLGLLLVISTPRKNVRLHVTIYVAGESQDRVVWGRQAFENYLCMLKKEGKQIARAPLSYRGVAVLTHIPPGEGYMLQLEPPGSAQITPIHPLKPSHT